MNSNKALVARREEEFSVVLCCHLVVTSDIAKYVATVVISRGGGREQKNKAGGETYHICLWGPLCIGILPQRQRLPQRWLKKVGKDQAGTGKCMPCCELHTGKAPRQMINVTGWVYMELNYYWVRSLCERNNNNNNITMGINLMFAFCSDSSVSILRCGFTLHIFNKICNKTSCSLSAKANTATTQSLTGSEYDSEH